MEKTRNRTSLKDTSLTGKAPGNDDGEYAAIGNKPVTSKLSFCYLYI